MKRIFLAGLLVALLMPYASAGNPAITNMQIHVSGGGLTEPTLLGNLPTDPTDGLPIVHSGQEMAFDFDLSDSEARVGTIYFMSRWDWPLYSGACDYACWYTETYNTPAYTFLPFSTYPMSLKIETPPYAAHLSTTIPVVGQHGNPPATLTVPSGRHKVIVGYTGQDLFYASEGGLMYSTEVHFENAIADYNFAFDETKADTTEIIVSQPFATTPLIMCLAASNFPYHTYLSKANADICTITYGLPENGAWYNDSLYNKYNTAIKLKNANPNSEFRGSAYFQSPCASRLSWGAIGSVCPPNAFSSPSARQSIIIPAGGEITLRVEDACGTPYCLMKDANEPEFDPPGVPNPAWATRGLNPWRITIFDGAGRVVLGTVRSQFGTTCSVCARDGTAFFGQFYNPAYGGYAPMHCITYNAAAGQGEPLKTVDKLVYLPGEEGTIYVGWYGSSGASPFLPIKAGSKILARIYRLDASNQKITPAVVEVEQAVPADITAGGVAAQQDYFIPFTYPANETEPLSNFVIESEMHEPEPDGSVIGWYSGNYCIKIPPYYASKIYKQSVLYCAPGDSSCGCARSVGNATINGRTGKVARFECSAVSGLLKAGSEYFGIMDFNEANISASVADNFLSFMSLDPLTGIESADITGIATIESTVRGSLGQAVITDPYHDKRYVVRLTPDISADEITVPTQFAAGIPAQLSALVTNRGWLSIGIGTGSEGLDNLRVKMDYGDGTTPAGMISNLTSTNALQPGMSLLADVTHTFSDVDIYTVIATADPATSPDLIVEGDEGNNEVSGDVTARPACSTVFCDNSFAEEPAPGSGPNCAPCADVPGYTCIEPTNYVCYNGFTSPNSSPPSDCDGTGSALLGCPACSDCVNNLDCESGLFCDGGICVASASAGPSATLSATKTSQTVIDFTYECKDPQKGSASDCAATPGCITSCELDVDTVAPKEGLFGGATPASGDAVVGDTFSHNYAALGLGIYTATLTTTPCAGLPVTATYIVQIGDNEWPTAEIITPANGAEFNEGMPVMLTGKGSDFEDKPSDLSYVWKIDGSDVGQGNLTPTGSDVAGGWGTAAPSAPFTTTTLTPGPHTITLEITDLGLAGPPAEPSATGSVSVTINIIPAVGDVKVSLVPGAPGISIGEEGGEFEAKVSSTNDTPVINVNVELKVKCIFPVDCTKSASCTKPTGIIPADGSVNVLCTFGPGAEADVAFAKGEQYSYTVKIIGVTCSSGITICNKPSGDSASKVFGVIKLQAISVPELPLVFAALAALAVIAILNRRK